MQEASPRPPWIT